MKSQGISFQTKSGHPVDRILEICKAFILQQGGEGVIVSILFS